MPADRFAPDDPREWLNRARSNLIRAREGIRIPDIYLEDLCFDAQQAAEKAIKGVLISRNTPFPYVHDLARLMSVLQQSGLQVPSEVLQAARLTRFAVAHRYPGTTEEVTRAEFDEAVSIATQAVEWAARTIAQAAHK